MVLALIAVVIVLDQAAKWWAWRHVRHAVINAGGDALVGSPINAWYSGRITGAALDLLDVGLLSIAVWALTSRRVSAVVRVTGALMIGGWSSNLLDRLGFHYWTAPGSVRGVVDFLPIGVHYYNVADLLIISCTPLFLLTAGYQGVRTRLAAARGAARPARGRARMRILALASTGLIVVVTFGAMKDGGVNAAPRHAAPKTTHVHPDPGRVPPPAGVPAYAPPAHGTG